MGHFHYLAQKKKLDLTLNISAAFVTWAKCENVLPKWTFSEGNFFFFNVLYGLLLASQYQRASDHELPFMTSNIQVTSILQKKYLVEIIWIQKLSSFGEFRLIYLSRYWAWMLVMATKLSDWHIVHILVSIWETRDISEAKMLSNQQLFYSLLLKT